MKKIVVLSALSMMLIFIVSLSVYAAERRGNPSEHGVLVGSKIVDNMRIQLEMEPSKGMFMPPIWMWMGTMGKPYHMEVKLEDPYSETRISNSEVRLTITKVTTGAELSSDILHPMWGGSGLHYAINGYAMNGSPLEDGEYLAKVTANPPQFMRGESNKHLWTAPISADFRFQIRKGNILSNSVVVERHVDPLPEGLPKDYHNDLGTLTSSSNMDIRVEFEDAAQMYMPNGNPMAAPGPDDIHLEVKLTDNEESGTRISYSTVHITLDNGVDTPVTHLLLPMWGGSGLHYGANAIVAPAIYDVTVNVGIPMYARGNHGAAPPPTPTWPADAGPYTSATSVTFVGESLP